MKTINYTKQNETHGIEFNGQFVPADELTGTQEEALRVTDNLGLWSFTATWATIQKAIAKSKRDTHADGRKITGATVTTSERGNRLLILRHAGRCPSSRFLIKSIPDGVATDLQDGPVPIARACAIYRVACKREAARYGFNLAMTPKEAATAHLMQEALA